MAYPQISDSRIAVNRPVDSRLLFALRERDAFRSIAIPGMGQDHTETVNAGTPNTSGFVDIFALRIRLNEMCLGATGDRSTRITLPISAWMEDGGGAVGVQLFIVQARFLLDGTDYVSSVAFVPPAGSSPNWTIALDGSMTTQDSAMELPPDQVDTSAHMRLVVQASWQLQTIRRPSFTPGPRILHVAFARGTIGHAEAI
jgi:hypothetical protein